ncbi:30S ribosomal protein S8 [Devosia sp.]|uniref:30S ribosomal protein S8 n=1 Tax=Devosia sp. TaxID=1871048 RepID=UPI003A934060
MSFSDPIGDMLTRIRNAQMRNKTNVLTPASTLRGRVLEVLKSEGFIRGYTEQTDSKGMPEFSIELKYADSTPVIRTIERVSRPGRRVYASVKNIPSFANGLGVSILSTPKGVMADHEARSQNLGGEVLCRVF